MITVIFMGTPQFAVPALQALIDAPDITVLGCLTQPDKPSGRGQKLTPPPVKQLAEQAGIPVFQPTVLRKDLERIDWLASQRADVFVTVAFGQILPQTVLDIPRLGTVNVHASLLPEFRGANPIQQAIIQGKTETGLTTMLTEIGVDTGPILLREILPLGPDESAPELAARLSQAAGALLLSTLRQLENGTLTPSLQDDTLATHAPKANKEDSVLDWTQPARTLHNKIRGQQPWPGASILLEAETIKVQRSQLLPDGVVLEIMSAGETPLVPGQILGLAKSSPADPDPLLWVQTGDGVLGLVTLQSPGKPAMLARDWANGALSRLSPTQKIFG